jgi:hypothetical protein
VLHPLQSELLLCPDELRYTSGAGIGARKKPQFSVGVIVIASTISCSGTLRRFGGLLPIFPEHITGVLITAIREYWRRNNTEGRVDAPPSQAGESRRQS